MERLDPIWVFISTFAITSFAGLAALLRSGKELTVRAIVSAMLNSGLLGLAIGMIWYKYYFSDNVWFLIGVSLLAGLGGMTVVDFLLQILRKGGIEIKFTPANKDKDGD